MTSLFALQIRTLSCTCCTTVSESLRRKQTWRRKLSIQFTTSPSSSTFHKMKDSRTLRLNYRYTVGQIEKTLYWFYHSSFMLTCQYPYGRCSTGIEWRRTSWLVEWNWERGWQERKVNIGMRSWTVHASRLQSGTNWNLKKNPQQEPKSLMHLRVTFSKLFIGNLWIVYIWLYQLCLKFENILFLSNSN